LLKPLWFVTPSSKGRAEVLVGGSIEFALHWLGWATLPSQLHKVIMSGGQIHFHGLWLGIACSRDFELKEEQLSAPLVGQNKTLLSCFLIKLQIPFPSIARLR